MQLPYCTHFTHNDDSVNSYIIRLPVLYSKKINYASELFSVKPFTLKFAIYQYFETIKL